MRFHIGSDHAGIELRRHLTRALTSWGHEVVSETGPSSKEDSVDYPDVAVAVCGRVQESPGSFGLLVCGTGQGVAMAANRIPGIRAGVCADAFSAQMIRAHNDANVLCLGARVVGVGLAETLLRAFVDTEFEGGRHARRVAKIDATGG